MYTTDDKKMSVFTVYKTSAIACKMIITNGTSTKSHFFVYLLDKIGR